MNNISNKELKKYENISAAREVIGCIMKDPSLIRTYKIESYMFAQPTLKIIFSAIASLYNQGARETSPAAVSTYISQYEVQYTHFKDKKGDELLRNLQNMCSLDNFEYNCNLLKKFSILREYLKEGINVSEIYDPDEVDSAVAEAKLEKLGALSLEDLTAFFKHKQNKITQKYLKDSNVQTKKAGLGGEEQLEIWKKNVAWGLGYSSAYLNTAVYGIRQRRYTVKSAGTGVGKALPNDTIIPTPAGFRKVGDIRPGDYLFGQNGKPTKVLQIHPQPEPKQVWKVKFNDNRVVKCCGEHLWEYFLENGEKKVADTKTMKEDSQTQYITIKINKPVEFSEDLFHKEVKTVHDLIKLSQEEYDQILNSTIDLRKKIIKIWNDGVTEKKIITPEKLQEFKRFGELLGRSLGLMEGYAFCVESMGCKVYLDDDSVFSQLGFDTRKIGVLGIGKTEEYAEMTCFTVDNEDHLFLANDYIVTHNTRTAIADICHAFAPKYYNKKINQWCINPNGVNNACLYIGTEMELADEIDPILWAYMADVPQDHIEFNLYEEGEEERVREAIKILSEEGNIYLAYCPEYDCETLVQLIEEYKVNYGITAVFFDYIHSTGNLIAEFSNNTNKNMNVREDQALSDLSNKIKTICRKYNIAFDTATQVTGEASKNTDARDSTIVRGAKAIVDKADIAIVAMPPTPKEKKLVESTIENMKRNSGIISSSDCLQPNLIYNLYKNRGGKYNKIKIWLHIDYSTMRVHDLFVTDYEYNVIKDFEKTYINNFTEEGVTRDIKPENIISQYSDDFYSEHLDDFSDNLQEVKEAEKITGITEEMDKALQGELEEFEDTPIEEIETKIEDKEKIIEELLALPTFIFTREEVEEKLAKGIDVETIKKDGTF